MTHFVALVIGDDIAGQLARYDENTIVERYSTVVSLNDDNWLVRSLVTDGIDVTDPVAIVTHLRAKWDDGSADAYAIDPEGHLIEWSTYNPDSKWDWWVIGGRWADCMTLLNGNTTNAAPADQIDWLATFANFGGAPGVVVAEGVWRARESYGWFGMSKPTDKADDWDEWFTRFVSGLGNAMVTLIDAHI